MALKNLIEWLSLPLHANAEDYHRQLLLFQTADAEHTLAKLTEEIPAALSCAVITRDVPEPKRPAIHHFALSDYKKVLGQEFDIGIFNAYCGFRPSALLALAGTLRFAGRLIIVCPPLEDWPFHSSVTAPHYLSHGYSIKESLFIRRLINTFSSHPAVCICSDDNDEQVLPVRSVSLGKKCQVTNGSELTDSQQSVLNEVLACVDDAPHLKVITAPRGRGKSALLGIIAATLINSGYTILLVSARQHSQSVFYRHLATALSCNIEEAEAHLEWLAPDNPGAFDNDADIILIDEAAALPLPVLLALTTNNSKCLLTTTTLGFEGSGLGFLHKFLLPRKARHQLHHFTLNEPVRWATGDLLENVLDETLLFSNAHAQPEITQSPLTLSHVKASQLESALLAYLYHLLSDSHYQTSPDDLMRLTDAPDVSFILAHKDNQLIGAVVINHEGGDRLTALDKNIAQGSRRVKGHLSAQSLALMAADAALATQNYWRINRIAVQAGFRRQGVGSTMLDYLYNEAKSNDIDWLTSSYASAPDVDSFWQNAGFTLVRKGNKPDKASGQVSKLVSKPISHRAIGKQHFLEGVFIFDMSSSLKQMNETVQQFGLSLLISARLDAYLKGQRSRELTGNAFNYLVLKNTSVLSQGGVACDFIVNGKSPEEIINLYRLTGRKEFERMLLEQAKSLYSE